MLLPFDGIAPQLAPDSLVVPNATLIGKVRLEASSSVWFQAVLRADNDAIVVGPRSNIQEGCICHVDPGLPLTIGSDCVVGHAAVLHGCTLGKRVLIGIGAKVLNQAVIEDDVMVAAGALVTERAHLQSGQLYMGIPARPVRELTTEDRQRIAYGARHYVEKAAVYKDLLQSFFRAD